MSMWITEITHVTVNQPENIIIIIVIKKCLYWKAGREWFTPYHSEDPSPTIQPIEKKDMKEK